MEKRKVKKSGIPKFTDEQDKAKGWAGAGGRTFLKPQSLKLARANSVQIALRLPSPDLAKARAIAERKGIGYQTLLKMLVHEGLQRVER